MSITSGSTTNMVIYDPDGRLLGEYDASGAPVADTMWLSPNVANEEQPFGGDDEVGAMRRWRWRPARNRALPDTRPH